MRGTPKTDAWPAGVAAGGEGPATSHGVATAQRIVREQLELDLQRLAATYPVFDPARFPALALTVTAHLPAARREDRALAGMLSLWIIAFDALVDEGDLDGATLTAHAAHYAALAGGKQASPPADAASTGSAGELAAALREIGTYLTDLRPAPALWLWWCASLRATIAAIVRQRELGRAGGAESGYAAMVPLLLDSIGVRPYLAAGAILGREPGVEERLPAVTCLADECALAIRLANDLRTWEKDEREGNVSSLAALRRELARAEPALTPVAAHQRTLASLQDRLAASHARCQALASAPGVGETEAGMARLEAITVAIYATDDYHTFCRDQVGIRS